MKNTDKNAQERLEIMQIEELIGYKFKNKNTLKKALTHSSFHGKGKVGNYEKLEFFGDSFLNFVIAKYIFTSNQSLSVGEMTKLRAKIVCTENLKNATARLGIWEHIKKSVINGEDTSKKLYADVYESLVGGIYIDGGEEESEKFVLRTIQKEIAETINSESLIDYKTTLQEYIQSKKIGEIKYVTSSVSGEDHKPFFEIELSVGGAIIAKGSGESKKKASQQCAKHALEKYGVLG